MPASDYFERANRETLLLVQVEHIDAVRDVEAIMALPAVDGSFIGPTDLALSMGLSRDSYEQHPDHRAAIARTLAACQQHGKRACVNTYSLADADDKIAQGFDCITLKSEADLLMSAGRSLLAQLRGRRVSRPLVSLGGARREPYTGTCQASPEQPNSPGKLVPP